MTSYNNSTPEFVVQVAIANFNATQDLNSGSAFYLFLGHPNGLTDLSPYPYANLEHYLYTWSEIIGLVKVSPSNACLSVPLQTWTSGNYYDIYRSDYNGIGDQGVELNGTPTTRNTLYFANFYVMTSANNIYKCLWNSVNNVVVPSTVMPAQTTPGEFQTSDGYGWIFMGSVVPTDVNNFLTTMYMPIRMIGPNPGINSVYYPQYLVEQAAISDTLSIHHCLITNGGSGYTSAPTVTIYGDGTGATGTAVIVANQVVQINMTNYGTGYTYANVGFSGGGGSSAAAKPILSPIGGHGGNILFELFAFYITISITMVPPTTGTYMPVVSSYSRIGLIANPLNYGTNTLASGTVLNATWSLNLSTITGSFSTSETIVGGTSGATAQIVSYDSVNDIIYYNNSTLLQEPGVNAVPFQAGETITGNTSSATAIITEIVPPMVQPNSGIIAYSETQASAINRSVDQFEELRITVGSS